MTDPIKYILYARKSSESTERQVESIGDQLRKMQELAQALNLHVVDTLTESQSAKQPNSRPIFMDMIARIERGEANGLLCWQLNRLSRNPADSGRLQWMLQSGVIKAIRTYDRLYEPGDNALIFSVESGVATQFILDLRKNTARGTEGKLSRGGTPYMAPIGYLNNLLDKNVIKDPLRFPIVRKMWDMMLTGNYAVDKVLTIATDEWKLTTPQVGNRGGKPMASSDAYRMFHSPYYYGMVPYKGKLYQGIHEPMITKDEFDRVQDIIGRKEKARMRKHNFAFTGIIKCGNCGCLITAEEIDKFCKRDQLMKNYIYYHCTRGKKDMSCNQPFITEETLLRQIETIISTYTISPKYRDFALEIIKSNHSNEVRNRETMYQNLEVEYKKLQRQLDNLTSMRIKDMIDDHDFEIRKQGLQNDIANMTDRINHVQDRAINWIDTVEKAYNFAVCAKERFANGNNHMRRTILFAMGKSFILKNGLLTIEPSEWLEVISKQQEITKKQPATLEMSDLPLDKTKTGNINPASLGWYRVREIVRILLDG